MPSTRAPTCNIARHHDPWVMSSFPCCTYAPELEAEQGAESPAIGPDGDASAHVAAALTALALRTAAAGRPGEGVAGDDGGDGGDGEGFAMEAEAGPAFRCSRAGCGRLAVPPCVLSCGCLVGEGCRVNKKTTQRVRVGEGGGASG